MTTYSEYQAQIADLQKKAEEVRTAELAGAKAQIKEIMVQFGLTIADIAGDKIKAPKSIKTRAPVPTKYRDDATGQTWTGRGRAPTWLAGKNKEDFLVK